MPGMYRIRQVSDLNQACHSIGRFFKIGTVYRSFGRGKHEIIDDLRQGTVGIIHVIKGKIRFHPDKGDRIFDGFEL